MTRDSNPEIPACITKDSVPKVTPSYQAGHEPNWLAYVARTCKNGLEKAGSTSCSSYVLIGGGTDAERDDGGLQ